MGFPSLHVPLQLAALPAELSTEHQAVQHTPTAELHRIPMMAEWTSPGGSVVKNPPDKQEIQVHSPSQEDSSEGG